MKSLSLRVVKRRENKASHFGRGGSSADGEGKDPERALAAARQEDRSPLGVSRGSLVSRLEDDKRWMSSCFTNLR